MSAKTGVKGGNLKDYKSAPYGNSVLVENTDTGEKMRLSHLSSVDVSSGDILYSGTIIGKSGATGNVTGPHLDIEYYDKNGALADVLKTPYGQYYSGRNPIEKESLARVKDFGTMARNDIISLFSAIKNKNALSDKEFEDYILKNL